MHSVVIIVTGCCKPEKTGTHSLSRFSTNDNQISAFPHEARVGFEP